MFINSLNGCTKEVRHQTHVKNAILLVPWCSNSWLKYFVSYLVHPERVNVSRNTARVPIYSGS